MNRFSMSGFGLCVSSLFMGAAAMAASDSAPVTFNKEVLPILQKNCQSCHRPGEVAPMSLLTYTDARPWAKSIKAAVASKKRGCRRGSLIRKSAISQTKMLLERNGYQDHRFLGGRGSPGGECERQTQAPDLHRRLEYPA